MGLEHITYCSEDMFREARRIAGAYGVHIHTHTSEQQEEVEVVEELFGDRPVHKFEEWGILKPGSVLAHCVWLDDGEIAVLAEIGTGVAHCPISNMKLASGPAPLQKYTDAGGASGSGLGRRHLQHSLSMFECMKYASLLQEVTHLDATAVTAQQAIRMATIEGARLLGIGRKVGSLEVGKQADVIAVDLWQPHLMPIARDEEHDPIPWNLVFAARAGDVRHVWVQGRHVIENGSSTSLDEEDFLGRAHRQTIDLLARRAAHEAIPMVGQKLPAHRVHAAARRPGHFPSAFSSPTP